MLFDAKVHGGLVDVRHKADLDRLLRTGEYEIALDHPTHGGIVYDEEGWEVEPEPLVAVRRTEDIVPDVSLPRPRGRPRKS